MLFVLCVVAAGFEDARATAMLQETTMSETTEGKQNMGMKDSIETAETTFASSEFLWHSQNTSTEKDVVLLARYNPRGPPYQMLPVIRWTKALHK